MCASLCAFLFQTFPYALKKTHLPERDKGKEHRHQALSQQQPQLGDPHTQSDEAPVAGIPVVYLPVPVNKEFIFFHNY